jgi:hypothetical protein
MNLGKSVQLLGTLNSNYSSWEGKKVREGRDRWEGYGAGGEVIRDSYSLYNQDFVSLKKLGVSVAF